MPRFCSSDSCRNSVRVAHFSNHNDINILSKCCLQCTVESLRIHTHFPLVNNGTLAFVNKFYRVFNGDDMLGTFFIDLVNQCGKCSGFSMSHRTHYQEKSLLATSENLKNGR